MKSADGFRGKRFALYESHEIGNYFKKNPDEFEVKHGSELQVGRVLAHCSQQIIGELPKIGFMVKGVFAESNRSE